LSIDQPAKPIELRQFIFFCHLIKTSFIFVVSMKKIISVLFIIFLATTGFSQAVKIAVLKYNGGGDWYANPTALPNLVNFCNANLQTNIDNDVVPVDVGSLDLFNYPFVHMTGHGNVIFSLEEAENLRNYLIAGGFLHVSDNYGMDVYFRREIKKVFPGIELVELPFGHQIYHQKYSFSNGLPKIHEHDDRDPQGFGLIYEGRLVCFYDFECDLGDGWESPEIHNDAPQKRKESLEMGANIIQFVFSR
jgi:hypothetical protein